MHSSIFPALLQSSCLPQLFTIIIIIVVVVAAVVVVVVAAAAAVVVGAVVGAVAVVIHNYSLRLVVASAMTAGSFE